MAAFSSRELRSEIVQAFLTFAVIAAVSVAVAAPSLVAIVRKHPSWLAITIVDVLFGWTILGWIAALVWALGPVQAGTRVRTVPKPRPVARPRTALRKRASERRATEEAAANDNVSIDNVSMQAPVEPVHAVPAALDADVYEEWLEGGSALAEAGADASAAAASVPKPPKVAA